MQPAITVEALEALYAQIQQVYGSFRALRGEAEGILETSSMPDSKQQLGDVLECTETAAMKIINHVAAISGVVAESNLGDPVKQEVEEHVSQIYEACSFQDISGQRIKKVISRLHALEEQLSRLSVMARDSQTGDAAAPAPAVKASQEDTGLLNGPQLQAHAPGQDAIDRLFEQKL